MREGIRKKRDSPEPQQLAHEEKSQQVLARLDVIWDDLEKSSGAKPVRRDAEHTDSKESWRKIDLATASQEPAAAWSDDDEDYDDPDRAALRFRKQWNYIWSKHCGSFEDITLIPPMRYTDEAPIQRMYPCHTLQIFSAKIAGIGGYFPWPLDVFGVVAIRDSIDKNRNIIFQRSRVECQTLTEEV
nr:unnamed protein product [Digitaria exilis]